MDSTIKGRLRLDKRKCLIRVVQEVSRDRYKVAEGSQGSLHIAQRLYLLRLAGQERGSSPRRLLLRLHYVPPPAGTSTCRLCHLVPSNPANPHKCLPSMTFPKSCSSMSSPSASLSPLFPPCPPPHHGTPALSSLAAPLLYSSPRPLIALEPHLCTTPST